MNLGPLLLKLGPLETGNEFISSGISHFKPWDFKDLDND